MNGTEYLAFIGITEDLWTYLKNSGRPVIIYGTGNGADKIIKVLENRGIGFAGFIASDEFVRGQIFHGRTVMKFSDVKQKYGGNIIVLTAFGSHLDSVIEHIYSLAEECEIYAPDVPVCGDILFDMDFFINNTDKFASARELLYDDKSKLLFDDIIRCKLTGRLDYLKSASVYDDIPNIIQTEKYKIYADLGAYNGDTVRFYSNLFPNLESAIAVEADSKTFKKLVQYAESERRFSIKCCNKAVSDNTGTIDFSASGNRGSNVSDVRKTTKLSQTETDTLDNILSGNPVDFIKYDVEGSESDALTGSKITISRHSPDLAVSLYHRSEDIFVLIQQVSAMCPNHKLYLRRKMCIPAWEIMLYAVTP